MFVYDFLKKKNYPKTATSFCQETQLNPEAETLIDTPDSFLNQWWVIFWEMFSNVRNPKHGSPLVKTLADANKQQTLNAIRLRQSEAQRQIGLQKGLSMGVVSAGMQPNGLPSNRPNSAALGFNPQGSNPATLKNGAGGPNPGQSLPAGVSTNGRATPTPGTVAAATPNPNLMTRSGALTSPDMPTSMGLPNGSLGEDYNAAAMAAFNSQHLHQSATQYPAHMRNYMGFGPNPNFPTVTQNMAEAGLGNRDPISLNAQEKSRVLDGMNKPGALGSPAPLSRANTGSGATPATASNNSTSSTAGGKKPEGSGKSGGGGRKNATTPSNASPPDPNSLADQEAKRRRSNTSGRFSPANNGPESPVVVTNNSQALLNSTTPIMNISSAGSAQMPQFNPNMQMHNQARGNPRNLSGPVAGQPNHGYNPQMYPLLAGATNNSLGTIAGPEMLQQNQRIHQMKAHSQFPHLPQATNMVMMNGQPLLNSGPNPAGTMSAQSMAALSQANLAHMNPLGFAQGGNLLAFNQMGGMPTAIPSPIPATVSGNNSKKRKATPQLNSKSKAAAAAVTNNTSIVSSPPHMDVNGNNGGPMSPAVKGAALGGSNMGNPTANNIPSSGPGVKSEVGPVGVNPMLLHSGSLGMAQQGGGGSGGDDGGVTSGFDDLTGGGAESHNGLNSSGFAIDGSSAAPNPAVTSSSLALANPADLIAPEGFDLSTMHFEGLLSSNEMNSTFLNFDLPDDNGDLFTNYFPMPEP
ncbi:hypothetical protein H4R33_002673 [Dimargaris cristalligena]|nr:hypothetical protein H4R33_002673 [Dimargaris cristalligena]